MCFQEGEKECGTRRIQSVETTYICVRADLKLKDAALAKTTPTQVMPNRYRPDDEVLATLDSL